MNGFIILCDKETLGQLAAHSSTECLAPLQLCDLLVRQEWTERHLALGVRSQKEAVASCWACVICKGGSRKEEGCLT